MTSLTSLPIFKDVADWKDCKRFTNLDIFGSKAEGSGYGSFRPTVFTKKDSKADFNAA